MRSSMLANRCWLTVTQNGRPVSMRPLFTCSSFCGPQKCDYHGFDVSSYPSPHCPYGLIASCHRGRTRSALVLEMAAGSRHSRPRVTVNRRHNDNTQLIFPRVHKPYSMSRRCSQRLFLFLSTKLRKILGPIKIHERSENVQTTTTVIKLEPKDAELCSYILIPSYIYRHV